ncbi:hypothetical protein [uncultured Roseovarius sp.]|uniref:hypothetical protein n=1 Tax=uncultured Roseovarius sp. TaxID=293344 RepID=UPI0025FE7336|nr:hypothetical protein [uncultured Roseovarius sp.]
MNKRTTDALLKEMRQHIRRLPKAEKIELAEKLLQIASTAINWLREDDKGGTTASRRRKLQGRETKLDANKPVSPVTVAEPHKPKPMKYKGKHRDD